MCLDQCEGAQETSNNLNTVCTGDIPLKKVKEELYEHTVQPRAQGEATEDVKTTGMHVCGCLPVPIRL